MQSNRTWRARLAQTLLPISNLSAGNTHSDVRRGPCGMLTPVLRLAGVIAVAVLASGPSFAQNETAGYPEDWTHHHVVFSDPGTLENALISGSYYSWRNVVTDPRFAHQRNKRSSGMKALADPDESAGQGDREREDRVRKDHEREDYEQDDYERQDEEIDVRQTGGTDLQRNGGPGLEKDWRRGILTGTVQPNAFPAKWSFGTTTASCANDYVVYPTGSAGSTRKASIIAFHNLYSGCGGTVPLVDWAYDTGGTVSTSPVLSLDGSQIAFIQVKGTAATLVLLKGNAGPSRRTVTGVLSASSPEVTISAGTFTQADVGAQITGRGIPPGDAIAAVLSATTVNLVRAPTPRASDTITVRAEVVVRPGIPPTATNAGYRACTAPCMTTLLFSGSPNDTFSAPFYDYAGDTLYVGDDSGNLHQFTGIFNGTPAETTTNWPVTLNGAFKVTSPVFDLASGYVFVGNMGGVLYAVGTGLQGTTSGSIHGTSSTLGDAIVDGPLLDPSAGMLYVFVTTNSAANNAVFQFGTNFTSGTGNGNVAGTTVGTGASEYWLYDGNFDNVYYQSAAHTGNLWVAGNTSVSAAGAVYRIAITANVMSGSSTAVISGITGNNQSWVSPITEFCNNGPSACTSNGATTTAGTDYIFFSVNSGAKTRCTSSIGNGCVLSYKVTNPVAPVHAGNGLNITNLDAPGCWATTGIVVDNSVAVGTLPGASQIYFINFNGNTAGGPTGTATSNACAPAAGRTIIATQASQSSP